MLGNMGHMGKKWGNKLIISGEQGNIYPKLIISGEQGNIYPKLIISGEQREQLPP